MKPSNFYPKPWVLKSDNIIDVAIIGAGQSGLAIAHGLRKSGVNNIKIFDAAQSGREGVWQSVARMQSLRTDKTITGPELGDTALSFQYWHSLINGNDAFNTIARIDRLEWQDYLNWFAAKTGASPIWQHHLTKVQPLSAHLNLQFQTPNGTVQQLARHLVVAGGMAGFGRAFIPPELLLRLPTNCLHHTDSAIDLSQMEGKSALVIGGSASAFDAAATALEQGATRVVQLTRAAQLAPSPNYGDLRDVTARSRNFYRLSDGAKWHYTLEKRARGSAPPHSIERATKWQNHQLREGASLNEIGVSDAGQARYDGQNFDLVIAGTGYHQGAALRPEYRDFALQIRQWGDLNLPRPPGAARDYSHWRGLPYLGPGFELLPRDPANRALSRIHVFTFAAILSHGYHVGDIASAHYTVPRLVDHLCDALFEADRSYYEAEAYGQLPLPPRQAEPA